MPGSGCSSVPTSPHAHPDLTQGRSGHLQAALAFAHPTPSLLAAYETCASPKEQESMLSGIKCGPLQR